MPEDKLEASQRISSMLAKDMNAQARTEIETLLRDWPGDAEVLTLAGDVYAWTAAPSTAYRHYNSAADTYNRLGLPDKMLSVHHKILELDPTLLDEGTQLRIRLLNLLVGAEDALIANKHESAVSHYQEAIRQFPNHTVTYTRLASLFMRMGRPKDAVEQYLTVARAFHQHGVNAKAGPYFERVLEIDPAHLESLGALVTLLEKEGRLAEAERPIKAAVQRFLENGDNDSASLWFTRLPESVQQDITPLRVALLLQAGDLEQAADAAKMLDLTRSEVAEWFKRMGRAALERSDSVSAEIYFGWANSQPAVTQEVAAPAPAPVAAAPAPQPIPQAVQPAPAPQVVPAAPAPELGRASSAPTMASPAPQSMAAPAPAPMATPAPPPAAAPAPALAPASPSPSPSPLASPLAVGAELARPSAAPAPAPMAAPAPPAPPLHAPVAQAQPMPPAATPVNASFIDVKAEDDRMVLQTMGEMCLAEEMFEEARQVFERLLRAEPHRKAYLELLNKSRAGLGLGPVTGPPPPPGATPPPPPPNLGMPRPAPQAATALGAPPVPAPQPIAPAHQRPELEALPTRRNVEIKSDTPSSVPRPVVEWAQAAFAPAPESAAPAAPVAPAPPSPLAVGAELSSPARNERDARPIAAPAPVPAPPAVAAPMAAAPLPPPALPKAAAPVPRPQDPQRLPALTGAGSSTPEGAKITRAAHTIQLGELPPSTPSKLDFDDDIIE